MIHMFAILSPLFLMHRFQSPVCGILLIGWIIGATNTWRLLQIDSSELCSSRYLSKPLGHKMNCWTGKVRETY
jgi:hypothetical protein